MSLYYNTLIERFNLLKFKQLQQLKYYNNKKYIFILNINTFN